MSIYWLYFVYGLCVMFYFMMAWLFFRKNSELLSRLVVVLMSVIGLQCLKDLFLISPQFEQDSINWYIMTAIDMVAEPLYAFILIELCRPRTLTWRIIIFHEVSFIAPAVLYITTHNIIFYYLLVVWAVIYGVGYALWTVLTIPKYHTLLKQRFSYEENINLKWLRVILASFFFILTIWIVDCLIIDYNIEVAYLICSLVVWMFICYFIYKHESVLDELTESNTPDPQKADESDMSDIGKLITELFDKEKIYLNPNLKLSDIAKAIGSNRTYVSAFFNTEAESTFYDFVNRYRIEHACRLLENTSDSLTLIAERSGFNSQQSFIRVFSKIKGMTPTEYRGGVKD